MRKLIALILILTVVLISATPVHAEPVSIALAGSKLVEVIATMIVYLATSGIVLDSVSDYNVLYQSTVNSVPAESFQQFLETRSSSAQDPSISGTLTPEEVAMLSSISAANHPTFFFVNGAYKMYLDEYINDRISTYDLTNSNVYFQDGLNEFTPDYKHRVFKNVIFSPTTLNEPSVNVFGNGDSNPDYVGRMFNVYETAITLKVMADGLYYTSSEHDGWYKHMDLPIIDGVTNWQLVYVSIPFPNGLRWVGGEVLNSLKTVALYGTVLTGTGLTSYTMPLSDFYNRLYLDETNSEYFLQTWFQYVGTHVDKAYQNPAFDELGEKPDAAVFPSVVAIPTPESVFGINKPFSERLLDESQLARDEYLERVYGTVLNPAFGDTIQGRSRSVDQNIDRTRVGSATFPDAAHLDWAQSGATTGSNTTTLPQVIDAPEIAKLDFSPLFNADLSRVFPFSIPFDLFNFYKSFQGLSNSAPVWYVDIMGTSVTLDLSPFDGIASFVRIMIYLSFCFGLMLVSRRVISNN